MPVGMYIQALLFPLGRLSPSSPGRRRRWAVPPPRRGGTNGPGCPTDLGSNQRWDTPQASSHIGDGSLPDVMEAYQWAWLPCTPRRCVPPTARLEIKIVPRHRAVPLDIGSEISPWVYFPSGVGLVVNACT